MVRDGEKVEWLREADWIARAVFDRAALGEVVGVIRQRADPEDEGVRRIARVDVEVPEPRVPLWIRGDPGSNGQWSCTLGVEGGVQAGILDPTQSGNDDEDEQKDKQQGGEADECKETESKQPRIHPRRVA